MKQTQPFKLTALLVAVSALTACGGGGGGSGSNTSTTPPVVTPPVVTTPVSSTPTTPVTPTPTDPAVTAQKVVDLLNQKRTQCGFNSLTPNSELAKAALNHANYLNYVTVQNHALFIAHFEYTRIGTNGSPVVATDPAVNPYASGYAIGDRVMTTDKKGANAVVVNYPFSAVNEDISVYNETVPKGNQVDSDDVLNQKGLNGLLAAPYHLSGLMSPLMSQVGVANVIGQWTDGTATQYVNTLNVVEGLPSPNTLPSNPTLINYPCNGITDTDYRLNNEEPNPIPSRNLATDPIGQPVYVLAPTGKTIQSVDVTISTGGATIETPVIVTGIADPNKILAVNEALIIPTKPLLPNTTYLVNYTVHYGDNTTENKVFSFGTKAYTTS